jgi:hypothetical protein
MKVHLSDKEDFVVNLGWLKRCKLAHALSWEYSYKRLKLAQLLGQLGLFLTWSIGSISRTLLASFNS